MSLSFAPLTLASTLLVASVAAAPRAAAAPAPPLRTESPHFTVSPGRTLDEVLVPYLVESLEEERARLAAAGVALPEGRTPVDIVASPAELDRASALTAREVAAGRAAACEQGKLVLVSPRAATGGYPWVDAAVAEYGRCVGAGGALRPRPEAALVRWRGSQAPQKRPASGKSELARDFARLGDILRARGRAEPARIEYEKAIRRGGAADPDVVARYAQAALATGAGERAEETLREAASAHPHHADVQAALGRVEAAKGDWEAARDAYAAAIRVDPFDAAVHAGLAAALEALGDATGASREKRIAEMLRG